MRLIAQLAIATHIPPAALLDEDDEMIATLVDILADQSDQARRSRRK